MWVAIAVCVYVWRWLRYNMKLHWNGDTCYDETLLIFCVFFFVTKGIGCAVELWGSGAEWIKMSYSFS